MAATSSQSASTATLSGVDSTAIDDVARWGGVAGMLGAVLLIAAGVVVGSLGLPDASDVETLTDFENIETGRIIEHFLYLGSVVLFALATVAMHRILARVHPAAALFGAATAFIGLVIMAASAVLHVSTAPLSELYTDPDTPSEDLAAIEYAWHGAQSIFDTMLTTGVFLVPIGIVLFGVAMRRSATFGSGVTYLSLALGAIGVVGATIAIIDTGSMFAALSVLAIAIFFLVTGWQMLRSKPSIDLSGI